MKRSITLMICVALAFLTGCYCRQGPDRPVGTAVVCPAAFGPAKGGCGILDISNKVVVPPKYDDIRINGNFLVALENGRIGLLGLDGHVIEPPVYEHVTIGSTYYSIIDEELREWKLKEEVPLVFGTHPGVGWDSSASMAYRLDGGRWLGLEYRFVALIGKEYVAARSQFDGKVRVFDVQENDVCGRGFDDVQYRDSLPFILAKSGGRFLVYTPDFKHNSGMEVDEVGDFCEGLLAVRIGARWGFLDAGCRQAIAPLFEHVDRFSEDLCAVYCRLLPNGEIDLSNPKESEEADDDSGTRLGYIDRSGRLAIAPKYYQAREFSNGVAQVQLVRGCDVSWIDRTGADVDPPTKEPREPKLICPEIELTEDGMLQWTRTGLAAYPYGVRQADFDSASGLVFFQLRNGWSFLDPRTGKAPKREYVEIATWSKDLVRARNKSKSYCLVDARGEEVLENCLEIADPAEGRAFFRKEKSALCGYLDERGAVAIPEKLLGGRPFSHGWAAALDNGWGFIDTQGNWEVAPKYEDADTYDGRYASVKLNGKWGVIDTEGMQVIPFDYEGPVRFTGNLAPFKVKSLWGCVDETGTTVLEPVYDGISRFEEGYAVAWKGDKHCALDHRGRIILSGDYSRLKYVGEGVFSFSLPGLSGEGLVTATGHVLCEPRFRIIGQMREGRIPVSVDRSWGVLAADGQWILMPGDRYVRAYSEGLAAVMVADDFGTRWGFLDRDGLMAIEPRYYHVGDFHEGLASFENAGKSGYLDRDGAEVFPAEVYHCPDFHCGLAPFGMSTSGQSLLSAKGGFITAPEGLCLLDPVAGGYIASFKGADSVVRFGVVGADLRWTVEPTYGYLSSWPGQYPLFGLKDGKPCYVDETGGTVFVEGMSMEEFESRWVEEGGRNAFQALGGRNLRPFRSGRACVFYPGEGWRVLDRSGRVAFKWPYAIGDFAEVAPVAGR
ncbi:MAG: WG repeat-containing protein [Candidatus Brocadiia bacterium]